MNLKERREGVRDGDSYVHMHVGHVCMCVCTVAPSRLARASRSASSGKIICVFVFMRVYACVWGLEDSACTRPKNVKGARTEYK